jgi:hypothetical protein
MISSALAIQFITIWPDPASLLYFFHHSVLRIVRNPVSSFKGTSFSRREAQCEVSPPTSDRKIFATTLRLALFRAETLCTEHTTSLQELIVHAKTLGISAMRTYFFLHNGVWPASSKHLTNSTAVLQ